MAQAYKPLLHLFCLTLKHGYIPSEWKLHKIIPVFKSGPEMVVRSCQELLSYLITQQHIKGTRTNNLCVIYNKLIDRIACQTNPVQFDFLQNQSTTQQLLSFLSNVFNDHNQIDVIYLDVSKAFDIVSHPHLLAKFSSFNIGGEIWRWFQVYSYHESETVCIY